MANYGRKTVILMADDDEDDRMFVREALEGMPVEVKAVENGEELVDYLLCWGKIRER
jgi:CheY-like chemotaxis protein